MVDAIIRMREKHQPEDFFSFINHIDVREINKKAIESLIKAGAFDSLNKNRAQLMAIYESVIEAAQCDSRKTIEGQLSLFEQNDDIMRQCNPVEQLPQVENFSRTSHRHGKEMLGVYVTGHPLDAYEDRINEIQTVTSEELSHSEEGDMSKDGMNVTVAGIISGMRTLITKKNNIMAFVQIEDLYGEIELVVFPNVYERHRDLLEEDRIIVVKGVVNCKEEEAPKIVADKIFSIEEYGVARGQRPVKIRIPDSMDEEAALHDIKNLLCHYPGDCPVLVLALRREGVTGWIRSCG